MARLFHARLTHDDEAATRSRWEDEHEASRRFLESLPPAKPDTRVFACGVCGYSTHPFLLTTCPVCERRKAKAQ